MHVNYKKMRGHGEVFLTSFAAIKDIFCICIPLDHIYHMLSTRYKHVSQMEEVYYSFLRRGLELMSSHIHIIHIIVPNQLSGNQGPMECFWIDLLPTYFHKGRLILI